MSEKRKGFNPWIATTILGALTILFSVFAIQEQATASVARNEATKLKEELIECERRAAEQAKEAEKALEQANMQIQAAMALALKEKSKNEKK